MNIKQMIMLDCTNADNYKLLKQTLLKLPFFKKITNPNTITIQQLEDAFWKISKKYGIIIPYIMPSRDADGNLISYTFALRMKDNTMKPLEMIYSKDLFEGLAKALLFSFAYSRKLRKGKGKIK